MEKEDVGASLARRRQLLEEEEQEEYEDNNNNNEVDESAVMDAIEEADSTSEEMQHPTRGSDPLPPRTGPTQPPPPP